MEVSPQVHAFVWRSASANNANTYLIDANKKILIDPGHLAFFDQVIEHMRPLNLTEPDIDLVLCTHAHPDHVESLGRLTAAGAKTAMHAEEWQQVHDYERALGAMGGQSIPAPDFFLQAGELLVEELRLQILHTPGHSPGSVCIYWPERKILITGDLVFPGGVGRTDLPGGDLNLLSESVARVAQLDIELLLAGHGEPVTGRVAVQQNFEMIRNYFL